MGSMREISLWGNSRPDPLLQEREKCARQLRGMGFGSFMGQFVKRKNKFPCAGDTVTLLVPLVVFTAPP